MAELYIHLEKTSFIGGERLYGAVYLNVTRPTAGTGVKINVVGFENYHYCNLGASDAVERERYFQDTKEYIQCENIQLYQSKEPLALGRYVFPFNVKLPKDIPASFQMKSESGVEWEIKVCYTIKAVVSGAESTCIEQEFMVSQNPFNMEATSAEIPLKKEVTTMAPPACFLGHLRTVPLRIIISLDKPVYKVGETVDLRLDFDVDGKRKPKVEQINVKLERELAIIFRKTRETGSVVDNVPSSDNIFSSLPLPCSNNKARKSTSIKPEGGAVPLWEVTAKQPLDTNWIDGISMLVPLHRLAFGASHLPQTVIGHHFFCMYRITSQIIIKGLNPIDIILYIPTVEMLHNKLPNAKPPAWAGDCKVASEDHKHSVPKHILDSSTYSKFPSFQII